MLSWSVVMVRSFRWIGRAHRGLRGDHPTAGGTDQNPDPDLIRGRAAAKRRMAKPGYFASRCKGPKARRKITGRSHCRSGPLAVRSPFRRRGRDSVRSRGLASTAMTTSNCRPSPRPGRCPEHEANDILRRERDWASARFAGDDDQHFELSHEHQELRAHSSITSQSEAGRDRPSIKYAEPPR
jgi:hypothetical protein